MKTYGLVGFPLEHSFSKSYFTQKFFRENNKDANYQLFPLKDLAEFPALLTKHRPLGLNVTIPYKQKIIPFVNQIHDDAIKIGAFNCLKIQYDSALPYIKGYNTDIDGFEKLFECLPVSTSVPCLILGNGGSAKAVQFVLQRKGFPFVIATRFPLEKNHIPYHQLDKMLMDKCKIIINTTPLGMYPDVMEYPLIPYHFLNTEHHCIDLIYNPEKTNFLKLAENAGASIYNGLTMLYAQAEKSWEIWNTKSL